MIYSAVAVWLDGANPYDFEQTIEVFRRDSGDPDLADTPVSFISLYPPSTFAALAPLGLGHWPWLPAVWALINVVLMVPLICVTGRLLGRTISTWDWRVVTMLCLVMGPVHSTFKPGQVTLLATVGILGGIALSQRGRSVAAGLLLGYACALKPQLAGFFVLALPAFGRWRSFVVAAGTSAALLSIGIARMEVAGVDWLPALRENLRLFTDGGTGDPRSINPSWYLRMDLPVLLHVFTDQELIVQIGSWVVALGSLALAMLGTVRTRLARNDAPEQSNCDSVRELVVWSIVALASLLPLYHRYYDAVILLPAMIWVLAQWRTGQRTWRLWLIAALLVVFLLPHPNVVIHEWINPRLPQTLVHSIFWRGTVMTIEVWAMLGLVVLFIAELFRAPAAGLTPPPDTATVA